MLIAIENPVPQSLLTMYCAVQPPAASAGTADPATSAASVVAHPSAPANRTAVVRPRRRQYKRFMTFPSARTSRPSERRESQRDGHWSESPKPLATCLVRHFVMTAA